MSILSALYNAHVNGMRSYKKKWDSVLCLTQFQSKFQYKWNSWLKRKWKIKGSERGGKKLGSKWNCFNKSK